MKKSERWLGMRKSFWESSVLKRVMSVNILLALLTVALSLLLMQALSVSSVSPDSAVGSLTDGNINYWTTPDIGTLEAPAEVLGGGTAELKYSNTTEPTTTIDYGIYFHEFGFAPVSFQVKRIVAEPIFTDSCVTVTQNDAFNNTQYDELVCAKVQSGTIVVEKDVVLPVQQAVINGFTYAYVT